MPRYILRKTFLCIGNRKKQKKRQSQKEALRSIKRKKQKNTQSQKEELRSIKMKKQETQSQNIKLSTDNAPVANWQAYVDSCDKDDFELLHEYHWMTQSQKEALRSINRERQKKRQS